MLTVLVRTAVIYFVAVFALRFMGKRQVGEMQLSELTTAVLLSELLASPAANPDVPLLYGLIPLATLVSLEVLISYGVTKSELLGRIFDNRPSYIIKDGRICQKELSKLRFSVNELMSELRQKDVSDISEVELAILESGGKLSVFLKNDARGLTRKDVGITSPGGDLSVAVICDGNYCTGAMEALGKTKKEVEKYLEKKKISRKEVFLLTMDKSGNTYLAKRGEDK